jgi:hypothetical protein
VGMAYNPSDVQFRLTNSSNLKYNHGDNNHNPVSPPVIRFQSHNKSKNTKLHPEMTQAIDLLIQQFKIQGCQSQPLMGSFYDTPISGGAMVKCIDLKNLWLHYAKHPSDFGMNIHVQPHAPLSPNLIQSLILFAVETSDLEVVHCITEFENNITTIHPAVISQFKDHHLRQTLKEMPSLRHQFAEVRILTPSPHSSTKTVLLPGGMSQKVGVKFSFRITSENFNMFCNIAEDLNFQDKVFRWFNLFHNFSSKRVDLMNKLYSILNVDIKFYHQNKRQRILSSTEFSSIQLISKEHLYAQSIVLQKHLLPSRYALHLALRPQDLFLFFDSSKHQKDDLIGKLNEIIPILIKYNVLKPLESKFQNKSCWPQFYLFQYDQTLSILWCTTHYIDLNHQHHFIYAILCLYLNGIFDFQMYHDLMTYKCLHIPFSNNNDKDSLTPPFDAASGYIESDQQQHQEVKNNTINPNYSFRAVEDIDDEIIQESSSSATIDISSVMKQVNKHSQATMKIVGLFQQLNRIIQDFIMKLSVHYPDVSRYTLFEIITQLLIQGTIRMVNYFQHLLNHIKSDFLFLTSIQEMDVGIVDFLDKICSVSLKNWDWSQKSSHFHILGVETTKEIENIKRFFDHDNHLHISILSKQLDLKMSQRWLTIHVSQYYSKKDLIPDRTSSLIPNQTIVSMILDIQRTQGVKTSQGNHNLIPLRFLMKWNNKIAGHVNLVLIDLFDRTLDIFESNDIYSDPSDIHSMDRQKLIYPILDDLVAKLNHNSTTTNTNTSNNNNKKWTLIFPQLVFPFAAVQRDQRDSMCAVWTLLFIHIRMIFPNHTSAYIIEHVLNPSQMRSDQLFQFILQYAFYIKQLDSS